MVRQKPTPDGSVDVPLTNFRARIVEQVIRDDGVEAGLESEWMYLHAGGAIGQDGLVADVEVDLPDRLVPLSLPAPPEGDALVETVRASLRFLNLAPDTVMMPSAVARSSAARWGSS